MIKVTRLNDSALYINADLIYSVEPTPDTVITFLDHGKIIVKEPADTVIEMIIEYKRQVFGSLPEYKESK